MDQQTLREWEARCIQEEWPECIAACPIHVDARALARHIGRGDWLSALAVLRKTMPLPGLLGRICDAPCQRRCKRSQVGDAIRIAALECACVSRPAAPQRIVPLPSRKERIAVAGGGLSSLTAAWDLARKGYAVTLFEPRRQPGEILARRYPQSLTTAVVDEQTNVLKALGVTFFTGEAVDERRIETWTATFDALYVGLDGWEASDSKVERIFAPLAVEAGWQTTRRPGLFAGGARTGTGGSPVWQAVHGRRAANSIDRVLQKVSLTAGRDTEGPQPTKLYTNIEGVAPLSAVPAADPAGYTEPEARAEAGRCLQCECLECVKVCPYLEQFGAYPRKYAREIYNNASIVMGSRAANILINSCSLCGLCERVCPRNFAMQDLCLEARQNMVENGKMPPSAHEFALQDMEYSRGEHFRMARHAPGATASAYLFFPGCQLCASAPRMVETVYHYLRSHLSGGVGLMLDCCGAPARWSGRERRFTEIQTGLRTQWEEMGRPRLITACSACYLFFAELQPPMVLQSLWEVLVELPLPQNAAAPGEGLAVHDPCTTRSFPAIQENARRLLSALGIPVQELLLSRDKTECCGFGGLMQFANPALAQAVVRRRAGPGSLDVVAYCAMCRDNLAAAGKRSRHLLDILFPEAAGEDPGGRPRPGWSRRRENRARLKVRLLETLWNEKAPNEENHRRLKLRIAADIAERLEQRRILEEDVKRVIDHAERSGRKFRDPASGRFKACCKPFNVTFWVEYASEGDAFVIYNAYAHRMEVA